MAGIIPNDFIDDLISRIDIVDVMPAIILGSLDDSQIQLVLGKMIKQGRESVKQYRSGGREDLAQTEEAEISVIQEFLPEALGMDVINEIIKSVMEQTGATSIKDMGKVMATLKPKIQGRADMAEVSARVKALLVSS